MKKAVINVEYVSKEKEFYVIYFNILNLKKETHKTITAQEITFLSILCALPLSTRMLKREKANVFSLKQDIAIQLGVTKNQISNLINSIYKHGVLKENEEEEIVFSKEIEIVRKTIKENLKEGDFEFDYTLNFKIEQQ
jgi:uncharacterized membrane protein